MKHNTPSALALSVILAGCSWSSQVTAATSLLYVVGSTTNQVYRYVVASNTAPVLDFTLTDTNLNIPLGLAFSPQGEMFVGNRGSHPYLFSRNPGYVRRYAEPGGVPAFNGDVGVGSLTTPHWLAFRGEELLVADSGNDRVRRYSFSDYGEATELPSITGGLGGTRLRGVTASPDGRYVFAAECCGGNNVQRYRIETNGNITALGMLPGPFSSPQGMAFSPWGELFVANPDVIQGTNWFVSRYTFAGDGTPQFNGSITHSNLFRPVSVAFSPWGELFVVNCAGCAAGVLSVLATNIARFTFTTNGTAVANGVFQLPADGGQLAFGPATDCPDVPNLRLGIAKSGTNAQFGFSTNAAAYVLDWTDALTPPVVWRPSYAARTSENGELRVTLPATNATRFFRLRCPAE